MNTATIAQHLNITESAIVRIEEWANVLFVVCRRIGARFVSKKVVEARMKKYTDIIEYNKALDFLAFSEFAGEKVVEVRRFSDPGLSPFLPNKEGWELTTITAKILKCTDRQKMQIKIPVGVIEYTGLKRNQFESNQGFYH